MTTRPLPRGYDYVRALGAGAFGDVVLARQRSLDRMVAIKRIHQFALTEPEAVVRFRREGQVLAALADPTIVRVYDFVTTESDALLIMEFVDGAPLADLLDRGALPAPRALPILTDVARALTTAARAGVAHRDVKPANIFVLSGGGAKLGDFGLARVVSDPKVFRTSGGQAGGTPAYFPPEVSQGAEPDERSDAYSFAVTAYEALTGRRPIHADNPMAMIAAHWVQRAVRPETFIAGFPAAATDALLQGMDKRPEYRLMPSDLVTRLLAVPAADWPIVARTPGATAPGPGSPDRAGTTRFVPIPVQLASAPSVRSRRRPWVIALSVMVLASAATATAVVIAGSGGASPHLAVASALVSVTPADGVGRCPVARFDFVGRIVTNGQRGTLVATWNLPGGRPPSTQRVVVSAGQREVRVGAHFQVTGQLPLRGRARLQLESTKAITALSPEINYSC